MPILTNPAAHTLSIATSRGTKMETPIEGMARDMLARALAKIEDPAAWLQGDLAKNADGLPRSTYETDACKFCALGAVNAAMWDDNPRRPNANVGDMGARRLALYRLARAAGVKVGENPGEAVVAWNDHKQRHHGEIVGAFRAAIKQA